LDTLLYIDTYFSTEPSPGTKEEFEKRITEDPAFAEEVAFYLSAKQAATEQLTEEKNERFKDVYAHYKKTNKTTIQKPVIRKLWPYIAAAAIITGIIFGRAVFFTAASPEQLADKYIKDNFQTLGVTMSSKEDSLQTGLRLFNDGKLNEALTQFESIANRDTSSPEAKKYAGIVSLRLQRYDKAITYFTQLGNTIQLYANPGKLYQALTLLKRNQPGDKQAAKVLLQQVVQFDLEGKETAKELLDKW